MTYVKRLVAKSVSGVAAIERGAPNIIAGWVIVASAACGLRLGIAQVTSRPAMQPAMIDGFATYALVVAAPAVFLALALRWFSVPEMPPQPLRWFPGRGRWETVSAGEAARHPLYGPYGLMFSLLVGILLNVPVRTLEYLSAIPPSPSIQPLWLKTLSGLCLADVVIFGAFYAMCFAAALKRHPIFPRLLMAVWLFDLSMQCAIKSLIHIIPGTPDTVAAAVDVLFDGNIKKVLISISLWLPYLLLSRRVNVTYRHRVRG